MLINAMKKTLATAIVAGMWLVLFVFLLPILAIFYVADLFASASRWAEDNAY